MENILGRHNARNNLLQIFYILMSFNTLFWISNAAIQTVIVLTNVKVSRMYIVVYYSIEAYLSLLLYMNFPVIEETISPKLELTLWYHIQTLFIIHAGVYILSICSLVWDWHIHHIVVLYIILSLINITLLGAVLWVC